MNCVNNYGGVVDDLCRESSYGINIEPNDNVSGYAWSSGAGWLNFDAAGPYPGGEDSSVRLNEDNLLTGWAQVANLGSAGWLNFLGESCSANGSCAVNQNNGRFDLDDNPQDGQSSICYNCERFKRSCSGGERSGLSCDSNADCPESSCSGALVKDNAGELMCSLCFAEHQPDVCLEQDGCYNDDKSPSGAICTSKNSLASTDEFLCTGCEEIANGAPNSDQVITVCSSCPSCHEYGVGLNSDSKRLIGWAWHKNNDGNGLGWVQFDPQLTGVQGPWLETRFGGIYSQGEVGSEETYEPPQQQFSATYEILAGGTITNFSTQAGEEQQQEEYEALAFPGGEQSYKNALGRIDFAGMYAGQYGQLLPVTFSTDIPGQLDGRIYHSLGDLTVHSPMQIQAGTTDAPSGAGLVLVEGDLYVNSNITYEDLAVTQLRELPSIAWIVKGDIIIDPAVTEVVGAFIALGDESREYCPSLLQSSAHCGRFSTGASAQPLDINGLVMARQFNFERAYYAADRGAERILYDGRALANTPPALTDIFQVLPVWQSVAPNQSE
jgi:hypothetical protein